jgi:hypothetical protein
LKFNPITNIEIINENIRKEAVTPSVSIPSFVTGRSNVVIKGRPIIIRIKLSVEKNTFIFVFIT